MPFKLFQGPESHANHSDLAQRQYSNLFPIEKKRVAHTEPAKQPELESELESMELPKEEKSAKQRKAKVLKEKEVVNARYKKKGLRVALFLIFLHFNLSFVNVDINI